MLTKKYVMMNSSFAAYAKVSFWLCNQ